MATPAGCRLSFVGIPYEVLPDGRVPNEMSGAAHASSNCVLAAAEPAAFV